MIDADRTGGAPVSGALSVAFILAWLQVIFAIVGCIMSILLFRRGPGALAGLAISAGLLGAGVFFLRRDDRARIFLAGESVLVALTCILGVVGSMAASSPAVFLFALPLLFTLAGAFAYTAPSVRAWTEGNGPGRMPPS